jgi:hypothetical protein
LLFQRIEPSASRDNRSKRRFDVRAAKDQVPFPKERRGKAYYKRRLTSDYEKVVHILMATDFLSPSESTTPFSSKIFLISC